VGTVSRLLRVAGLKAPKPRRVRSADDIKQAAAYAERVFTNCQRRLCGRAVRLQGCACLEVGPGRDFGAALLMRDRGALVTVADRFLEPWDDTYHPAVYRELLARVGWSPSLERVLDQSSYDGVIKLVSAPAEDLGVLADAVFDLVVSNAVFEHLYDHLAAARELRRVSRPGALHLHQVDFRDHRNMTRPLEHLLLSRWAFHRRTGRKRTSGCQTRRPELTRIFEKAGYVIDEAKISNTADDAYLDDFIPRLRRIWASPYRRWSREELRVLGVHYQLRA
jgi:SAM-dependent methyltransferase